MPHSSAVIDLGTDENSVAAWIARFLQARGVDRVFGLQGGHIQPIWDHCGKLGIRIIDVRDEGAAVHMAHAHAELTGHLGVCMATAGPGVTNCVTGAAHASLARMPVLLIGGCPPRPQANMGPQQDLPHVDIMRPVTRHARTLRVAEQVIREIDEGVARAMGDLGEPGPVYLEIPTDVLRTTVAPTLVLDDWMQPKAPRRIPPDPDAVAEAVEVLWSAKRPLVITGRGARAAAPELLRFLDALGALYLDTQESRGLVPPEHPAQVGAMRGAVMAEADTLLVIGRKLDFQLAYGSPAVFANAKAMVRIADNPGELIDNRRGKPELLADPALALAALVDAARHREPATETAWTGRLRDAHETRVAASKTRSHDKGPDGYVHPMAIFDALRGFTTPDTIAIADGGDLLSFARVGLEARTYMDNGVFGCLGIGVPYAIAASLAFPERRVVCVTGDGAYGINAMEIDTAVRHGAKFVVIVSNNGAWNIERHDQATNYGGRVLGTTLAYTDYAAMGAVCGAYGERVTNAADLPAALERAFANAPAVIDVTTSREVVSSDANKGLGFVPDYQPLAAWNEAERKRRTPQ